MDRSIITNIEIAIPDKTIELGHLLKILRTCSNIRVLDKTLIQATSDYNLKPTTTFVVKQTKDPSFSFTGSGLKNIYYIVPSRRYYDQLLWITESKKLDKKSIIKQFEEEMNYCHLKEYEEEFAQIFDLFLKKVIPRV